MKKHYLFEGEEIITTSNNDLIMLTNRRIRKSLSKLGEAHITSMHLENISTIEIKYNSTPLLLMIGSLALVLSIIIGIPTEDKTPMILCGAAGLVFIILYFITRSHSIIISSNGGAKIAFETKGMDREAILEFVNKVEKAKSILTAKTLENK